MLAASLTCMLCLLIALVLVRQDWLPGNPMVPVLASFSLLAPALLLGYVRSLIRPGYVLGRGDFLHLLSLLGVLLAAALLGGRDSSLSNQVLQQARGGWPPNRTATLGILFYLIQVAYFGRAFYELQVHRKRILTEFSFDERVTLGWLRILIGFSLALASMGLCIALVRLLPGVELWPRSLYSMTAILAIYYLIGFMAIFQPNIFATLDRPADATAPGAGSIPGDERERDKYETSALTAEVAAQYWELIQAHMEQKRPYLDNRLRIADLAEQLEMPVHHLSQVVNRHAGQSFFDFINRYRVALAMSMLAEGKKAVSVIAFDAGFNSESAFYRQFKKVTGKTPKQYRRGPTSEPPPI